MTKPMQIPDDVYASLKGLKLNDHESLGSVIQRLIDEHNRKSGGKTTK